MAPLPAGSTISLVSSRVNVAALPSTSTRETVKPWRSIEKSLSGCVDRAVIVRRPSSTSVAGS